MELKDQIRAYWDERARDRAESPASTTDDVHLRYLEVLTVVRTFRDLPLPPLGRFADVGCGDGLSTLKIACELPGWSCLGVDYSVSMITNARRRLSDDPALKEHVAFVVGDVMELDRVCADGAYDLVLTDRCLINLDSPTSQAKAIEAIARCARPAGYYIAIENFIEGHDEMNRARQAVGLPAIPVRWHNCYFREREFIAHVDPFFEVVEFRDFSSSYYFATRVIYSKMCQIRGETPDYEHEIHQLAVELPWVGRFSPIRLVVLRRR